MMPDLRQQLSLNKFMHLERLRNLLSAFADDPARTHLEGLLEPVAPQRGDIQSSGSSAAVLASTYQVVNRTYPVCNMEETSKMQEGNSMVASSSHLESNLPRPGLQKTGCFSSSAWQT